MPSESPEPLYESFFGLREQPFALSTDPRFLYLSASHRRAHDELLTGLRRREGVLLLTGETGTGKTTLCRAVVDELGHRTFSALILNPYMSDAEVLRVILRDFGLVSRDEIRRGAFARADVPQLLDTLEGFLRSLVPLQSYAVVIIDEAQNLPAKTLDQIRVLGSMEENGQRLIQIVLVGQPNLLTTLKAESLRAMNERVSRRTSLAPLQPPEVDGYIKHRLEIAGARGTVAFAPEAVQLITDLSRGLPRRVNLLCDRSLEEARGAKKTVVSAAIVKRAAKALAGSVDDALVPPPPPATDIPEVPLTLSITPEERRGPRVMAVLAAILVLLGVAAGGYYVWTMLGTPIEFPASPPHVPFDRGVAIAPLPVPDNWAEVTLATEPGK